MGQSESQFTEEELQDYEVKNSLVFQSYHIKGWFIAVFTDFVDTKRVRKGKIKCILKESIWAFEIEIHT